MNLQAKFASVALFLFGVSVAAVAPQIAPGQSAAVAPAQLRTNGPTRSTPSTPRPAADEEFDAFVQTQFPPQPPIGTRPATATAAAPQAPPPEGVFFAAVSQLRDVITPAMRKELASSDPLARDLAVSALAPSIDRLYEAGKKLQEHERTNRLGTSNSPFIIKDADYGEMKGAFDGYRQASTASEKSEAALKLVELVREVSEVYEKNWPYNIGVINALQMMGRWVTEGISPQSPVANAVPMDKTQAEAANRSRLGPREADIRRATRAVRDAKDGTAKAVASKELVDLLNRLVRDAGEAPRRAGETDPGAGNLTLQIRGRVLALDRAEGDVAKSEAELELREVIDRILASHPELDPPRRPPGIATTTARTGGQPSSADSLAPFQQGARPVTRQVTEEVVLPNGQRQFVTREIVEQVIDGTTSPLPTTTTRPAPATAVDRLDSGLRSAIETFRNAEGEAKTDARQRLQAVLRSYFQRDISRRATEVDKLEEQVRNLRTQLERRREKSDELIDLQMKLIENEAEGLAFFTGPPVLSAQPESTPPGTNPPANRDWYGRPIPPEGSQAMNPPATRDWYGRPLNEQSANTSLNLNSNILDIKLDENGRVPAFNLSGRTWPDVLAWYAKLAKRSLDWQELPSGNVNVGIASPSSLENVRNLLSQRLLDRGFVLSESDGVVQVRKSEDRNPRPPADANRDRRLLPPGLGPSPPSENRKTPPQSRQPIGPDDALLGPVNPPMPYPPGTNAATELPTSLPPVR